MIRRMWLMPVGLLFVGCGGTQPEIDFGRVEWSGPPASSATNLSVASDGRVLLTWFEPAGDEQFALMIAVRAGDGWSEPRVVARRPRFFVNWADLPSSVELSDGSWMVNWPEKTARNTYAYHVRLAISRDQGLSWSDPVVPHRDDSPREHGFVSMVPRADGSAEVIWLDGRNLTTADAADERGDIDTGEMSVRATTVSSDGTLGPEVLLDKRVCECCQTAMARTSSGIVAAYRDRSEAEIRNIAVVRKVDGEWTDPQPVHDDNWYYPGCPVNGPQLSASGDTVAIVWFTAPEQKPAVLAAFSFDAGASFGTPVRIDDGDPLGRVDVVLLPSGAAAVSWLERTRRAAEVRVRVARPSGTVSDAQVVTVTSERRASGFPRMVVVGDSLLFAWTEVGDSGGVRVRAATVRD
ncbi:MAG: sialidase family protein [Gemmatimonadales bacterium]